MSHGESFRQNEGHAGTQPIPIWLQVEYIEGFFEGRTCAKYLLPICNSLRKSS